MSQPIVHMFPCLKDNYGFLLHDPATGETATIDTPDADRILAEATAKGWTITQIWNTHWHPDHAGGNADLVAYADGVKAKRTKDIPTVPTTIGAEKRANPFLRADDPKLQAFVGHPGDVVATFAEVRERKNKF